MKILRNYIDKIKPKFEKGGKYHMFFSTFEAFETFLFVPDTVTKTGSHIRDNMDMKRTMAIVVVATIPALLFGMWNTGYQHFLSIGESPEFWATFFFGFLKVLPIIVVAYVVGLGVEFIFAQMRGHEVNEGFLVSGMLIPLIVPADVPLWMVAVATIFAVVIGKEVFGGTGMNILNPALTTRAFLFFAYPTMMSGDKVWIPGLLKGEGIVDGFSGATVLGQAAQNVSEFTNGVGEKIGGWEMFFGNIPGSIGETSTLAILLGAVILIYTGVASWKIMFSVFAGGAVMGLILNAFAVNEFMALPYWQHLLLGGFAFGAVFMATDPVSGTQTEKGKWIYGFLIGFLAILIRVLNPAYPEGVMLAILLMNVFAPLIDHYVIEGNVRRRMKRMKLTA
ncbi:MAG: NADH:ubiquinone reductase (Na(+)-transporting) subunit B [Bacteroidales bacterium]|nr:NADH:ubiquinone reductase (Na(+)-transporting) subunit B [Bacteroidales bacterium]MCF8389743.1 NADH:ubiquinone reductase (Na(+)-transporting) subunit B [Bacteroidales bacterium]